MSTGNPTFPAPGQGQDARNKMDLDKDLVGEVKKSSTPDLLEDQINIDRSVAELEAKLASGLGGKISLGLAQRDLDRTRRLKNQVDVELKARGSSA